MEKLRLPNDAFIECAPYKDGWGGCLVIDGEKAFKAEAETSKELVGKLIGMYDASLKKAEVVKWKLPYNARVEIIPDANGFTGVLYADEKEVGRTEQCCIGDCMLALVRDWNANRVIVMRPYSLMPGKIEVHLKDKTWTATYKDPNQRRDNVIGEGATEPEAIGNLIFKWNIMLNSVTQVGNGGSVPFGTIDFPGVG